MRVTAIVKGDLEKYMQEYWVENGGMKDSPDYPVLKYELVDFHSSRPGHDLRYALDGTKLSHMGYKHPISFSDSLKKTVFWTLDHSKQWLLL